MICYECQERGDRRDAVALCHHCSAALCSDHAVVLTDPVTVQYPIVKTIVLPLRARVLLCQTCRDALQQRGEEGAIREALRYPSSSARQHISSS